MSVIFSEPSLCVSSASAAPRADQRRQSTDKTQQFNQATNGHRCHVGVKTRARTPRAKVAPNGIVAERGHRRMRSRESTTRRTADGDLKLAQLAGNPRSWQR